MVSEWRIAAPDITRNHHARETWLSFLRGTVTPAPLTCDSRER